MKPTHTSIVVTHRSDVGSIIGRDLTERELIQMNCFWAGQPGHEKCGWCLACSYPRSIKVETCNHPEKYIFGREDPDDGTF